MLSANAPYLGAPHADDPVHIACGIVEIGDSQSMLAGRDPVPFGGRVDLENMGPGAEDWLLPAREMNRAVRAEGKLSNGGSASTSWHLCCIMHRRQRFCYSPPLRGSEIPAAKHCSPQGRSISQTEALH